MLSPLFLPIEESCDPTVQEYGCFGVVFCPCQETNSKFSNWWPSQYNDTELFQLQYKTEPGDFRKSVTDVMVSP